MPITVNTSGVLHELSDVAVNNGGTLYHLDTVNSNNSGVLHEIYSAWKGPETLTWSNGATGFSVSANMGFNVALSTNFDITKDTNITVTYNLTKATGTVALINAGTGAAIFSKTITSEGEGTFTEKVPAGKYTILSNGGGASGRPPNLSYYGYSIYFKIEFSKA